MTIYSGFFPLNIVIFHSYVSLTEGIFHDCFNAFYWWVVNIGIMS